MRPRPVVQRRSHSVHAVVACAVLIVTGIADAVPAHGARAAGNALAGSPSGMPEPLLIKEFEWR